MKRIGELSVLSSPLLLGDSSGLSVLLSFGCCSYGFELK